MRHRRSAILFLPLVLAATPGWAPPPSRNPTPSQGEPEPSSWNKDSWIHLNQFKPADKLAVVWVSTEGRPSQANHIDRITCSDGSTFAGASGTRIVLDQPGENFKPFSPFEFMGLNVAGYQTDTKVKIYAIVEIFYQKAGTGAFKLLARMKFGIDSGSLTAPAPGSPGVKFSPEFYGKPPRGGARPATETKGGYLLELTRPE